MIINGGARKNGSFFAKHLLRTDQNERVNLVEFRGLGAETVPDAFREMRAIASGTQCANYFYHANLNTRTDEVLTPEQWAQAVDTLESELHLNGQPRFVVEHEKDGRTHRHVVWGRIDPDSMTAISDAHNYRRHEVAAAALEIAFGHHATDRALTRDEGVERPERNMRDWESFRAGESKIDPKAIKAELTALWNSADSGSAFAAALHDQGYILARGDRRDFCVIDQAGDEHSLARRIGGVKAAEIRARMADVDRDALPSVEKGREIARGRAQPSSDGDAARPASEAAKDVPEAAIAPAAEPPLSDLEAILAETLRTAEPVPLTAAEPEPVAHSTASERQALPASDFEAVLAETIDQAQADAAQSAREDRADNRHARWRSWLESMRDHVAGWWDKAQDWLAGYFGRDEPEDQGEPQTDRGPER